LQGFSIERDSADQRVARLDGSARGEPLSGPVEERRTLVGRFNGFRQCIVRRLSALVLAQLVLRITSEGV
jgi:hypothetical protein